MDQKEYSEIKALLAQLNERIDALYQDKPAFELIVPDETEPEFIPEPEPEPEAKPEPERVHVTKPKPVPTIGDLFTNMNPGPTVAEVLARSNSRNPLKERISFNDKYLFTKVLFNQDAGLFNNTIDILEPMTSMREVESYLGTHFPDWDVTSPAVHRFLCQLEDHVR